MQVGIVGLPNVGKSALFKAMTGMNVEVSNYPFTTTKPINGTAPVPDPRLNIIGQFIKTRKFVPATIELVDIPAIVTGSSHGEGMGNAFLEHVRQVDALAHVVRCFDDPDIASQSETINPVRDAQLVETELMLADLQVLESAITKAERRTRTGDKAAILRLEIGKKACAILESEKPLRLENWSDIETRELRSLGMITIRPVLYIANVDESEITESTSDYIKQLNDWVQTNENEIATVVPVCAKLAAEIGELEPDEQKEMLDALGLSEPALAILTRALYQLLGLQSFYTAGDKEIRAWTIKNNTLAPEAAGVIHSDIQRGFIRCETYSVDQLVQFKSEQAIKSAGKLRSEGKNYTMQDGDVCHFLFNV